MGGCAQSDATIGDDTHGIDYSRRATRVRRNGDVLIAGLAPRNKTTEDPPRPHDTRSSGMATRVERSRRRGAVAFFARELRWQSRSRFAHCSWVLAGIEIRKATSQL